jgi:signal transduction histidine kinase
MQKRLWIRIVVSFLLFLTLGTIGLVLVLDAAFQRLSHSEFAALAGANADFIRATHLQPTDRLAGYLSQMLGAEVQFRRVAPPDARHEAVTVPLAPGMDLTLIRERPTLRALLLRPVAIGALAAFWGLWFALATAVLHPYLKARRLAFLGQMATGLAHQIRNPVAAIRLHAQLLQKTNSDTAALIVDEATAIEGLLNQWMFLARPDPPRKSEVLPAELIAQTVRLLAPAAAYARVQIVVDADSGQRLQADARRLCQVFHNIILNAIQAMPGGGTLTITARDRAITFADTGPGFSASALSRWAEMLYSEKEGGMGIGLSVAREIIRAHGGRLSVANQPRGGAVVRIEL